MDVHKAITVDIVINEIIKTKNGAGEGCSLNAYWDRTGRIWTIGYGCTGADIGADTVWTLEECEQALSDRLDKIYDSVVKVSPILLTAKPEKCAAIVDFVYNGGLGMYTNFSVKPLIDEGSWGAAAERLKLFNKSGGVVLKGLTKRRKLEAQLLIS